MRHQFTCTGCGYSATVSGGPDAGMAGCTTTIHCLDCQKLYDVLVETFTPTPQTHELLCPRTPAHTVRSWTHQNPCPRCQGPMQSGGMAMLWD